MTVQKIEISGIAQAFADPPGRGPISDPTWLAEMQEALRCYNDCRKRGFGSDDAIERVELLLQ